MSQIVPNAGVPVSQTSEGSKPPEDTGRTKPIVNDNEGGDDEEHGVPLAKDKKVPAKQEPAKEAGADDDSDKPDEKPKWDGKEYIELPHAAGQAVIDLLKESNVSPVEANAIFKKALETENLEDVDWDVLKSRLGPAKFTLAKAGIEAYYNAQTNVVNETVEVVHKAVGSAENWQKIVTWAKTKEGSSKSFAKELAELRVGIEAGGRFAKQAALDLVEAYNADPKNKGLNTKDIMQGTTRAPVSGAPMTRKEYHAAVTAGAAEGKPASYFADIRARRTEGRRQGL